MSIMEYLRSAANAEYGRLASLPKKEETTVNSALHLTKKQIQHFAFITHRTNQGIRKFGKSVSVNERAEEFSVQIRKKESILNKCSRISCEP